MVSHYYELTGKSRQIVDCLEKLYYVREGIDTLRVNIIEQIAKKFLCFLLLFPVVPLTLLAHVIRILVREKIPTEIFEQERTKWNNLSCQLKRGENGRQMITEKLIASRINPSQDDKFLVLEYYEGRKSGGYFCAADGQYRYQGEELAQALQDNKKVLICLNMDPSFSASFQQQFPDYQKLQRHLAENLLGNPHVLQSKDKDQFPQWIDQGLDVLFFDRWLRPIDFSQQISLAVSYRVQLARSYAH